MLSFGEAIELQAAALACRWTLVVDHDSMSISQMPTHKYRLKDAWLISQKTSGVSFIGSILVSPYFYAMRFSRETGTNAQNSF